jgi:hypothetical protein
VDSDFFPLAAVGATGILIGRMLTRRSSDGARSPVQSVLGAAGWAVGKSTATTIRAGGLAAQGIGLAAVASGNAANSLARAVEGTMRPSPAPRERPARAKAAKAAPTPH